VKIQNRRYYSPDEPPQGGTPPVQDPPKPDPSEENNSTIREMRAQVEAANKAAKEAEAARKDLDAKLKEKERAEMDEIERLKSINEEHEAKLKEAEDAKAERDALAATLEQSYKDKLAKVEEDYRANAEALSKHGNWAERIAALDAAIGLIPKPKSVPTGGAAGSGTTPPEGTPGTQPTKEPLDLKQFNKPGIGIGATLKPISELNLTPNADNE
jgi:flagellar biosynthesis GTPase FlhF